ncbi:MAG: AAA family ATPase [Prevotella sp.]|nr:AAA family ATPase [Prevotella sp.]
MNNGIKFRSISLKSFRSFDDFEINCEKDGSSLYQWTVLLGNNNTGKTSILKAIANLRPVRVKTQQEEDKDKYNIVPASFANKYLMRQLTKNVEEAMVSSQLIGYENISWMYSNHGVWSMDASNKLSSFYIFGYGVSRYPSKTSLSEQSCGDCDTLFSNDQRLVNIEEWLMQLDYAAKNHNASAAKRLEKVRELICGNVFPEISDFKFESSDEMHNYVLFLTKDGWFRYTQLGYGYQSMLSWVIDLCKRMFEKYPDSDNPLQESAVVLIDEIDLHLHPKWQRDIIAIISNVFRNVQFIVTTHSPLVIQSMNEVNLYVLRRQGEKLIAERSPINNFSGWTVEEILRETMKMDNDVYSDVYQKYFQMFDEGLDQDDKEKAENAYQVLTEILHPQNPERRLLKLQLARLTNND